MFLFQPGPLRPHSDPQGGTDQAGVLRFFGATEDGLRAGLELDQARPGLSDGQPHFAAGEGTALFARPDRVRLLVDAEPVPVAAPPVPSQRQPLASLPPPAPPPPPPPIVEEFFYLPITGPRHLSRVLYMVETGDPIYLPGLRLSDILFKRTADGWALNPAGSCDLGQPLITDQVRLTFFLTQRRKAASPSSNWAAAR